MSLDKLHTLLEMFDDFPDPADRTDLLLSYADQFTEVPPDVATRPFPEKNHIPQCESDAYIWAMKKPDGTLEPIGNGRTDSRTTFHREADAIAVSIVRRCHDVPPRRASDPAYRNAPSPWR